MYLPALGWKYKFNLQDVDSQVATETEIQFDSAPKRRRRPRNAATERNMPNVMETVEMQPNAQISSDYSQAASAQAATTSLVRDEAVLLQELLEETKKNRMAIQMTKHSVLDEEVRLPIRPTYFTGKGSWHDHCVHFKNVAKAANWPEIKWGTIIGTYLTESAAAAYEKISEEDKLDWNKFRQRMSKELGESTYASQGKLLLHVYEMNTNLIEAAIQLENEARAAFPKADRDTIDEMAKGHFFRALPETVRQDVTVDFLHGGVSLPEFACLAENCRKLKNLQGGTLAVNRITTNKQKKDVNQVNTQQNGNKKNANGPPQQQQSGNNRNQNNGNQQQQQRARVRYYKNPAHADLICHKCQKKGHISSDCGRLATDPPPNNRSRSSTNHRNGNTGQPFRQQNNSATHTHYYMDGFQQQSMPLQTAPQLPSVPQMTGTPQPYANSMMQSVQPVQPMPVQTPNQQTQAPPSGNAQASGGQNF